MDFWVNLAISVLLQVIANKGQARKIYPALAKIHVKTEFLALADPALMDEIQHQRAKESKK